MTPEEKKDLTEVIDAVISKRHEESQPILMAAKRSDAARQITAAVIFFGSLVAGAVVAYRELEAKPTIAQVDERIEYQIAPVREKANDVDALEVDVSKIHQDVSRVQQVQDLILEQTEYEGEVLKHIAAGRKGPIPEEPESLKDKRRKLIR